MNDKMLIRFLDIKTDNMLSCYETTNWSEALKMYDYFLHNDLQYDVSIDTEERRKDVLIKDIELHIGNAMIGALNSISIWVEVI